MTGVRHPPAGRRAPGRGARSRVKSSTPKGLTSLTRLSDELNTWVDVRVELSSLQQPRINPGVRRTPEESRASFELLLDGAMRLSQEELEGGLAGAVKFRMRDIPADTFCELMADRFARAYAERDSATVAGLIANLLPTRTLQRAVDERLPIPFLQEVGAQLARQSFS